MIGDQRIDQFAERFAFEDLWELVQREADAMIGHARLRKIISADALRSIARSDQTAPLGGARRVLLLPLHVVEPRAQNCHCASAVAMLRALVLHEDDDVAWD